MRRFTVILGLVAVAAFANTSEAQRRDRGENIPAEYRPPAGQCRIWIDGIAPGLQPKPTDCDTAERAAGERTRIIYGSQVPFPSSQAGGLTNERRERWCNESGRRNHPDCRDRDWDRDDDEDTDEDTDDRNRDRNRNRNSDWRRSDYPQRLPEMRTAILYQRGERPEQVRRWVGERDFRVEVTDADNNGRPERATWLIRSRRGRVVQIWTDRNRDGRADRIEFFRNGKRVRVIE